VILLALSPVGLVRPFHVSSLTASTPVYASLSPTPPRNMARHITCRGGSAAVYQAPSAPVKRAFPARFSSHLEASASCSKRTHPLVEPVDIQNRSPSYKPSQLRRLWTHTSPRPLTALSLHRLPPPSPYAPRLFSPPMPLALPAPQQPPPQIRMAALPPRFRPRPETTFPNFNRKPLLCAPAVSWFCTFSPTVDTPVDNSSFSPANPRSFSLKPPDANATPHKKALQFPHFRPRNFCG
jgi:hypothetical protein